MNPRVHFVNPRVHFVNPYETVVMVMVTALNENVVTQEAFRKAEEKPEADRPRLSRRQLVSGNVKTDESGNPVVVSKDFIFNLLSLAIGGPPSLEGNLGTSVDLKV